MDEFDEALQQSYSEWLVMALGIKYIVFLPLMGIVSFVLSYVVVRRGRGPFVGAALMLLVLLPPLLGGYGTVESIIASGQVIAASGAQPKPSEFAAGLSMALAPVMVGMLLMIPSILVGVLGSFIRSLTAAPTEK